MATIEIEVPQKVYLRSVLAKLADDGETVIPIERQYIGFTWDFDRIENSKLVYTMQTDGYRFELALSVPYAMQNDLRRHELFGQYGFDTEAGRGGLAVGFPIDG